MQSLPNELRDESTMEIKEDNVQKSLGVFWGPHQDEFRIKVETNPNNVVTKRTILSEVAKLFDPLGWLAPVVIQAKLLIQELWLQNLEWDQPASASTVTKWREFYNQLPKLEELCVPRWIKTGNGCKAEPWVLRRVRKSLWSRHLC